MVHESVGVLSEWVSILAANSVLAGVVFAVVLIRHEDGLETFFAHLGSIVVDEGQRIEKGAVIATVGSTGKSTGPYLHFEIRKDGEAVEYGQVLFKVRP